MARFTHPSSGDGSGLPGPQGDPGTNGADGLDSLFLGTWNSVTEFLAEYQGGPVGLADGDWWAFVKDNTDPNKIYVVREDPNSVTGWVIDDNEHFVLPQGPQGDPGADGADGADGATGSQGLYYLGNYVSGNGYVANLAVVKGSDNNLYIATSSGGLGDPVGNAAEWSIFLPKGEQGTAGADGTDGADGSDGTDGANALWNYTGEYNGGSSYAVGDIATYDGQLWYRYNSNGGNVGDTPSPGLWNLLAAKGADGADGADGAQGDPGPQGDPGADATLDTGTTTINSYNPVWSGTGLAYTNTPATGSYIKIGNLITVQIDVLFTNVSNFGTGAYSLTLPFASKYHTDVYGGSIHKITNQGIDHYSLKGHLAPTSSTFTIWAIGSSAADQTFNNNTPVGIDTDDKFHMSFSYICE